MTQRRTSTNGMLPFGTDDFRGVVDKVSEQEWDAIFSRWRKSYYATRRKALGDFATGKITGLEFSATLSAARHKELGGLLRQVTVSSNAKLKKMAARALFVRERLKNPTAPEEEACRHVIEVLKNWAAASTVYGYLKPEPM